MLKKLVSIILCTFMTLSFVACGNTDTAKKLAGISIEIEEGDVYVFNDASDADVDLSWKCSSDNEDVAYTRSNRYIFAMTPGNAIITVDKGDSKDIYNVTVKESADSNKIIKINNSDIKDKTAYLGTKYNAFNSNYLISANDVSERNTIFRISDVEKIFKICTGEIQKPDDFPNVRVFSDDTSIDKFITISGTNSSEYAQNYTKQISGELNINVADVVGGSGKGEFHNISTVDTSKTSIFTTKLAYHQRYYYSLEGNNEELRKLAMLNESVWKDLCNSNIPAEQIFEKYGTHIVVGCALGGRTELDYSLSSDNSTTKKEDLLSVEGNLNLQISVVKGEAKAAYKDSALQTMASKNILMKTSVRMYGGNTSSVGMITDLESFSELYPKWHNTLSDETISIIGAGNEGLMPIWELLPYDTYEKRVKEFQDTYKELMSKGSESVTNTTQ